MRKAKTNPNARLICLRVYLQDRKQLALVTKAAKLVAQQTSSRHNISRFAREALVAKAIEILREQVIAEEHTKHTLPGA